MSQYPTNSLENAITPCLFTCRQGLYLQLEKQSLAQLPPEHEVIEFIKSLQPVLSHLLEVYTLIVNFVEAGNNNAATWSPLDKHWGWIEEYGKVWEAIENVFKMSAFIASEQDADKARENCRDFMTGNVVTCNFGYEFFLKLVSKEVHDDIGGLFDQIELFCERIEQECDQALA